MIIEVAINELDLAGLRLNPPKHCCCWLMLWAKEFSKSGIQDLFLKGWGNNFEKWVHDTYSGRHNEGWFGLSFKRGFPDRDTQDFDGS